MDLNKLKMKKIKAWLVLEPNFPGVSTPQSSEWIIYIISYTYNPLTAPWGGTISLQWPTLLQVIITKISISNHNKMQIEINIKIVELPNPQIQKSDVN